MKQARGTCQMDLIAAMLAGMIEEMARDRQEAARDGEMNLDLPFDLEHELRQSGHRCVYGAVQRVQLVHG